MENFSFFSILILSPLISESLKNNLFFGSGRDVFSRCEIVYLNFRITETFAGCRNQLASMV